MECFWERGHVDTLGRTRSAHARAAHMRRSHPTGAARANASHLLTPERAPHARAHADCRCYARTARAECARVRACATVGALLCDYLGLGAKPSAATRADLLPPPPRLTGESSGNHWRCECRCVQGCQRFYCRRSDAHYLEVQWKFHGFASAGESAWEQGPPNNCRPAPVPKAQEAVPGKHKDPKLSRVVDRATRRLARALAQQLRQFAEKDKEAERLQTKQDRLKRLGHRRKHLGQASARGCCGARRSTRKATEARSKRKPWTKRPTRWKP